MGLIENYKLSLELTEIEKNLSHSRIVIKLENLILG